MGKPKASCADCGATCEGIRCRPCNSARRRAKAAAAVRTCSQGCGREITSRNASGVCLSCIRSMGLAKVERVSNETMQHGPTPPQQAVHTGNVALLSDTHFPYHCGETITACARDAQALGIKTLVILGDIVHAAKAGKHPVLRKGPTVVEELLVAAANLEALCEVFETVHLIRGNHDDWVEKEMARAQQSVAGRNMLSHLAGLLKSKADPHDVADSFLRHYLESAGVRVHSRPRLILNGAWRLGHPKSAARVSPQAVRKLAAKHRKHYVGGHNHLFGIGFEESGRNVAFNIGPACIHEKFPYADQQESDYPTGVRGYGFIYATKDSPEGRLIPVALHANWFRIADVVGMHAEA